MTIQHDWDRTEAVRLPALPRPGFVATDHPDDERHVGMTLGKRVFDVVLALEIVEHVSDVDLFLRSCGEMVKPGGLLFLSTLNRTAKAWALAIVGAEYVLGWLPRGTHDWDKFIKPEEIEAAVRAAGWRLVRWSWPELRSPEPWVHRLRLELARVAP